jgi:hypothetical protein
MIYNIVVRCIAYINYIVYGERIINQWKIKIPRSPAMYYSKNQPATPRNSGHQLTIELTFCNAFLNKECIKVILLNV